VFKKGLFDGLHRRSHELADGFKDHPEMLIDFFSICSIFRDSSAWDKSICLNRTKARIISMFTCTAGGLFNIPEGMATPAR
jgi:hypothetical protein